MPHLFNYGDYDARELSRRVGRTSQVAGIRQVQYIDGRAAGVRALDIHTGSGLIFTVLVDRCMDIYSASYRGIPLAWHSLAGVVSPAYFEPEGAGWLRSWGGGLLTTCGFEQVGSATVDQGVPYGLHGRAGNLPAENMHIDERWENDEYIMTATGQVWQGYFIWENYLLTRQITTRMGKSTIEIHDQVKNPGHTTAPFEFLYHINIGFPLVDEGSRLLFPSSGVTPRDDIAARGLDSWELLSAPRKDFQEQVFEHDMVADDDGFVTTAVANDRLGEGLGIYVKYAKVAFPFFAHWNQCGEGAYTIGLEPGNCHVQGRAKERADGTLQFLEAGEQRDFYTELGVLEGADAISALDAKNRRLARSG